MDIRPGRRRVEDLQLSRVQTEEVDDVGADARGGGCREGTDGDGRVREGLSEPAELFVCGPEVMAPFANAMGLIDGDPREFSLRVDGSQISAEPLALAELRGHVEQTRARMAGEKVIYDLVSF